MTTHGAMPTFETDTFILRPLTLDDAAALNAVNQNPLVMKYIKEPESTVEETREYLRNGPLADYETYGYGRHACIDKASGKLIGFSGIKYLPEFGHADVGYRFLPEYWGKGLATQTASITLQYGLEQCGLTNMLGIAIPENHASIRVLEKLGMRFRQYVDYFDTKCSLLSLQPL
ncbi:GNAT family N-acetyltransferase [Aestuariibacter sp. AA17]|uniref:GNAT family N-acetyltransferase n=1 Tax=Fluctibacter corallii TaxID=2984329 RepID=A0ABT3A429_9ALTE|nr:GNAT family N-acetyltransferase [Aestuariibacter sp. AA17]MCV2883443.1 GNAT family N-acetyltransferase [Aestuariibacter sp. AA17]